MTKPQDLDAIYAERHFDAEIIALCVRWYITYAPVTIAGIELAHRIHKHQFSLGQGRPRHARSLQTDWAHALA